MQDLIVIGGSYAGMAAALQLARARRKVLMIDAGQRRNRFAGHSYGFLGQDGRDPAQIWTEARAQLAAYPGVTWLQDSATHASGAKDAFTVTTAGGAEFTGRRILLATGVTDELPPIPGLAERWGRSVFHCPYCHGYELNQGRIGVIAAGPMSFHQAQLLPEWGDVTFFTDEKLTLAPDQRQDLVQRGVTVEDTAIAAVEGDADIRLADGRVLPFAGLFTASRTRPSDPIAGTMGCAMTETGMGSQIRTDEAKQTSIPGVYACGDVARAPHSLSLAVGDGAWAGAQLHRSLVWPDD
ncbi:NAD(P)/FAD-dependent oxidoreductase [Szabonella alba]|uniref:Thioredoxin reductase n=1 Tax=Szabonella alba TaxID=2804194 RepID=A0A8K0XYP8_9RHOB|nr:NAD(P)/FAD-dependent oxidoreductase [Szabonella alba]MBL4916290.1 NAD(P)/FAD-dependent oxidoreductase [Szabonella alba]